MEKKRYFKSESNWFFLIPGIFRAVTIYEDPEEQVSEDKKVIAVSSKWKNQERSSWASIHKLTEMVDPIQCAG